MSWPIVALIALIALAIGLFAGYLYRKNGMEKKIGQTEEFVANMLEDATHKAEEKKKGRSGGQGRDHPLEVGA